LFTKKLPPKLFSQEPDPIQTFSDKPQAAPTSKFEKMQLDYNKLRQANITRELTELSAFFLQ
jgi:hypothetical protein